MRFRAYGARASLAASQVRSARRAQWGLLDQAVSSLTNFSITLLVARESGMRGFGIFSIGLTLYIFLLWASRCVVTDPFIVRLSAAPVGEQVASARHATGAAFVLGLTAGTVVALVGVFAEPAPHRVMLTFGLAMPALFVQDSFRYVLFGSGRARDAAVNDLVWLLVQSLSVAVIFVMTDSPTTTMLVSAFGTGGAVAALLGARQTGVVPSVRTALRWIGLQRDIGTPFLMEYITITGTVQVVLLTVGAVAGVIAVGELRAAMLLMGPLTVLFMGAFMVATPEAVRLMERSPGALPRLVLALGAAMLVTTGLWTAVVLLLPDTIGAGLLGANWEPGRRLLPPVAALVAGNSSALAALVGLRALGAARESLRARLWGAPAVLAGGVVGAWVGGPYGAAVGLAAASWIDVVLAGNALRRAFERYERPVDRVDPIPQPAWSDAVVQRPG